jgi:hypothetical protein
MAIIVINQKNTEEVMDKEGILLSVIGHQNLRKKTSKT